MLEILQEKLKTAQRLAEDDNQKHLRALRVADYAQDKAIIDKHRAAVSKFDFKIIQDHIVSCIVKPMLTPDRISYRKLTVPAYQKCHMTTVQYSTSQLVMF